MTTPGGFAFGGQKPAGQSGTPGAFAPPGGGQKPSPFGQAAGTGGGGNASPFGAKKPATASAATGGASTPFGQKPAGQSPFGQKPAATTTAAPSPFGQKPATATAAAPSPFGQKPATTTAASSPFGAKPGASSSPFGSKMGASSFGSKPGTGGFPGQQQQQQQGGPPRFSLQPKQTPANGPTSQASATAAAEGKEEDKKKTWEDEPVENEVAEVVAEMKAHFEDVKKTRSNIQQHISNKIRGMDGIVSRLHTRLLAVASAVDRTVDDVEALKEDTLQTASDAALCERLHASDMRSYADPYTESSSPVTEYFQRLLAKFEKQLSLYRSQTRELELAVTTTPAASAHESAQALQELLQMQAQSFVDLCAQAQHIHERVTDEAEKYRAFYKNLPKGPKDPENPFVVPKPKATEEMDVEGEEPRESHFGLPAPFNPYANPALLRQWQQQQAMVMAQYGQQQQQQQQQMGGGLGQSSAFGAQQKPSPFGQQGASPFGAKPAGMGGGAFGNQQQKPSPFGGQQGGSPFGQRPAATTAGGGGAFGGAKPNPFGQTATAAAPSPFGNKAPQAPGPGTSGTRFGF